MMSFWMNQYNGDIHLIDIKSDLLIETFKPYYFVVVPQKGKTSEFLKL